MKANCNPANFAAPMTAYAPSNEGLTQSNGADYSANMLRRTTAPPVWPPHVDHFALERVAREMRQDYIVSLVRRAKEAITTRFAHGVPPQKLRAP